MICRNHADVEEGVQLCARCSQPFCADCIVNIRNEPFCGACKTEKLLDLQSGYTAGLQLAPLGNRFAAMFIDGLIIYVPTMALLFVAVFALAGTHNEDAVIVAMFSVLILWWIGTLVYEALLLARNGQTLGKRIMHVRVVRPDGSAISTAQAWGRSALRAVLISAFSLLNYVPAFATKDKTCVHDLVAGTRVVRAD